MAAPGRSHTGRRRQNGFALIVVLNIVVILSGIAIVASHGSQEGAAIAAHFRADAAQRSLAEGAMALTASRLLTVEQEQRWIPDGRPYGVSLFGQPAVIRVQDESGKFGLNTADEATLAGAFTNSGIPSSQAADLAAAIEDWRDPDDARRLGGAEREDYAAAGFPDAPANSPFLRNAELRGVLGMTEDAYRTIDGIVSAYTHATSVDLSVAPLPVLNAVYGAGSPEVAAMLADRNNARAGFGGAYRDRGAYARSDGLTRHSGAAEVPTYSITMALGQGKAIRRYEGVFSLAQDPHGSRLAVIAPMVPSDPDADH